MKDFISTAIIIKMKKKNIHGDCADLYKASLSSRVVYNSNGFPSFFFSTINNSLLSVVLGVDSFPPDSAHGRNCTLARE